MVGRLFLTSLALASATGSAAATAAQEDVPVRVWLSRGDHLRPGDRMRAFVRTRSDGYLVVLHAEPDGRVRVLFPVDPYEDHFVRGGEEFEIRGRGDRDAIRVYERSGEGTVYVGHSRDPFRFDKLVHGDHWDYRLVDTWLIDRDAEAELTALVQRMATGTHFDYDLISYQVGDRVATRGTRWYADIYGWPYGRYYGDPWWGGFGLSIGVGFHFGDAYPFYGRHHVRFARGYCFDPFLYDPFWCAPFGVRFGYYDSYWYDPYGYDPFYFRAVWHQPYGYRPYYYSPVRVVGVYGGVRYRWAANDASAPSPLFVFKERARWGEDPRGLQGPGGVRRRAVEAANGESFGVQAPGTGRRLAPATPVAAGARRAASGQSARDASDRALALPARPGELTPRAGGGSRSEAEARGLRLPDRPTLRSTPEGAAADRGRPEGNLVRLRERATREQPAGERVRPEPGVIRVLERAVRERLSIPERDAPAAREGSSMPERRAVPERALRDRLPIPERSTPREAEMSPGRRPELDARAVPARPSAERPRTGSGGGRDFREPGSVRAIPRGGYERPIRDHVAPRGGERSGAFRPSSGPSGPAVRSAPRSGPSMRAAPPVRSGSPAPSRGSPPVRRR